MTDHHHNPRLILLVAWLLGVMLGLLFGLYVGLAI